MGYSKVVDKGNGKIVIVHQLGGDGLPYAEDVTIEVQAGVNPARLNYLASLNGKVGTVSYGFTPTEADTSSIKFPEV